MSALLFDTGVYMRTFGSSSNFESSHWKLSNRMLIDSAE